MSSTLNNVQSWTASVARLGKGLAARRSSIGERPEKPLELFEFEACPYCRKVREVLSELDLVYLSWPCGRGSRHRARVVELGGKTQFPFLVDPNTDVQLYESEDITTYLHAEYGQGRSIASRIAGPLNTVGASVASIIRPRGRRVRPDIANRPAPEAPLVLYNFEASPYCRKVREALIELDLPCEVRNVAKRSARRPELVERGGKMQVPYLVDPNTDTAMYESDDIVRYLDSTYGRGSTS